MSSSATSRAVWQRVLQRVGHDRAWSDDAQSCEATHGESRTCRPVVGLCVPEATGQAYEEAAGAGLGHLFPCRVRHRASAACGICSP